MMTYQEVARTVCHICHRDVGVSRASDQPQIMVLTRHLKSPDKGFCAGSLQPTQNAVRGIR